MVAADVWSDVGFVMLHRLAVTERGRRVYIWQIFPFRWHSLQGPCLGQIFFTIYHQRFVLLPRVQRRGLAAWLPRVKSRPEVPSSF